MLSNFGRGRFFTVSFATGACLALAGCGPGVGDLNGKVTFENKPVCSGSVLVQGSDGIVKGGEIKPDSTYRIEGIAAGAVKVSLNSPDPGEMKVAMRKKDQEPPAPKDRSKWFAIPEDYADFDKSGLTFNLKRGSNNWDIPLLSK